MSEQHPESPAPTAATLQAAPRVYANGLAIGYSKTECVLTFIFANEPVVSVILPFPVAKALSEQTAAVLADFEKRSGQKIPHPADIIPDLKEVPLVKSVP